MRRDETRTKASSAPRIVFPLPSISPLSPLRSLNPLSPLAREVLFQIPTSKPLERTSSTHAQTLFANMLLQLLGRLQYLSVLMVFSMGEWEDDASTSTACTQRD